MKEQIKAAGLDFDGCIEKGDFVARAHEASKFALYLTMLKGLSTSRLHAIISVSEQTQLLPKGVVAQTHLVDIILYIMRCNSGLHQNYDSRSCEQLCDEIEENISSLKTDGINDKDLLVQLAVFAKLLALSIEREVNSSIQFSEANSSICKQQEALRQEAQRQEAQRQEKQAKMNAYVAKLERDPNFRLSGDINVRQEAQRAQRRGRDPAAPLAQREAQELLEKWHAAGKHEAVAAASLAAHAEEQRKRQRVRQHFEQERGQHGSQTTTGEAQQAQLQTVQAQLQAAQAQLQAAQAQLQAQQSAALALSNEASSKHELTAKLMALRQHIAFLEERARKEFKKANTVWSLEVVRGRLVTNVLEIFGSCHHHALIWRRTHVTYVDEDGVDEGGLTADLHSSFWREVLRPEHGLFEQLAEGGAYLPRADGNPLKLANVGRFLLKSVLDDHPTGCGLSAFLLEYLSGAHEVRAFDSPQHALQLLATVDRVAAQSLSHLLHCSDGELADIGLSLDDFDDTLPSEPLSARNVAEAVVARCRRKLLVNRQEALAAVLSGFTLGGKVDLRLQLAQHRTADLSLLLQGKPSLSVEDIVSCFDWAEPHSSSSVSFLRDVLNDATALNEERRMLLLRWCTGLNALSVTGLSSPIKLKRAEGVIGDAPDGRWPEACTCHREVTLPAYSSKAVLQDKLKEVLTAFDADGSFGQQ